jgi:RimJ/RimL family protein N-acetyltransferase
VSLPTIPLSKPGWALRAWREADAAALAEHAGNINVWRNMSDAFPHPYTLEIANVWVTRGHVDFGGDNWAIAFNDAAVGGCGVAQQSAQFRCNAEIGYWLAQPFWRQGVGTLVAQTRLCQPRHHARLCTHPCAQHRIHARGRKSRLGARGHAAAKRHQRRAGD